MPNDAKPLVIAEKPSMARDIAKHLPGPLLQKGGYMETPDYTICSAVGHLYELAEPAAYGEQYAAFPGSMDNLPIEPPAGGFKLEPKADKKSQLALLKKLVGQASSVIHAGDPDREGQAIVDQVLLQMNNKKSVQRVILPDLEPKTVRHAFANLQDNKLFHNQYQAAYARACFDWILGMSMSRALCIQGRQQGCYITLSVGRIQTPVLNIIKEREEAIRNFVPVDHFTIRALCGGAAVQPTFWARWLPPGVSAAQAGKKDLPPEEQDEEDDEGEEATTNSATAGPRPPYLDEATRLIDKAHAEQVVREIKAAGKATVTRADRKEAKESAPLLFELNALSSLMERKHGMDGKEVAEACQSLYQKGFQSYPRTDSQYLPHALKEKMPELMAAITQADPALGALMGPVDLTRSGKVWNDAKCKVHYALIPTGTAPNLASLSEHERWVYQAVARQLMAQFYPDCIVDKTQVELDAAGHRLVATGRLIKSPGWRVLFSADPAPDSEKPDADVSDAQLPVLTQGQVIATGEVELKAQRTTPPPRYTEATLKHIMKNAWRLVSDPVLRKKLKETEGIGTAATRIPTIATLLKRGLLQKKGKYLLPPPITFVLVNGVPPLMIRPDLTAQWEQWLTMVEEGKITYDQFMAKVLQFVRLLVDHQRKNPLAPIPKDIIDEANERKGGKPGATSKSAGGARKGAGSKTAFPPRPSGPPVAAIGPTPEGAEKPCSKCKKGVMKLRVVQKEGPNKGKQFLACSNFDCKNMEWPK
jgi:DNA topoisomerase-3